MTLTEAIEKRISCRAYTDMPLDPSVFEELSELSETLSREGEIRIVLVGPADGGADLKLNGRMFSGTISTYAALIGPDDDLTREKAGFFGEKLVLHATQLGLGTCWVAGTFDRSSVTLPLAEGEVLHDVIPMGNMPSKQPFAQRTIRAGLRRRNKKPEAMYKGDGPLSTAPSWIRTGIDAVIKGPSAVNEQPVVFAWEQGVLRATLPYLKRNIEYTDLGIAKLHFQIAAQEAGISGTWEWGNQGAFLIKEQA